MSHSLSAHLSYNGPRRILRRGLFHAMLVAYAAGGPQ
jgi:hypothetical protein